MSRGSHYCCAPGCSSNTHTDLDRSFFRFPKDMKRCFIWIQNCGRLDLQAFDPMHLYVNYKLCSLHFENSMFAGMCGNKLKKMAIPTIFNNVCADVKPLLSVEIVSTELKADENNDDSIEVKLESDLNISDSTTSGY
ncbi:hypothetical protein ILUMI_02994 [Ignelater luminosus]|uniref:THAP-type domain-containing protein n=1 Tax=Ignelater luminosus TaxID=2038154 RepID=A0A8K0GIS1_IGNLU|nr:hypothetical protein ILUMI_02994 [Ignelater luminosus]